MISNRVFKGVAWSGVERFSVQIIQFLITIILARILSPNDFGIIAIILVLMNILQVFNEVGFGAALIQKIDRDELDFSTVFVFNIIWGIILYTLLFFISPFFASFFNLPNLTTLIRILGINLIISSFIIVQRTKLIILVDFKTQAKASFISTIISGFFSIYYAYRGFGVMSLILQVLISNFINTILIWVYTQWHPKFVFSTKRFYFLLNYSYKLILARLFNVIFQEIYSLSIGKVYDPIHLGYYNRAKSFISISTNNITSIVQRVSVPILCEVQYDKEKLSRVLLEFIQKTAFIVFPILCGIFVLAEPIITIILTEKWLPCVWILKILCPIGFLYVISTFNINIFNVTGRTDLALKAEIIKKLINTIIIIIAVMISFNALIISQIIVAIVDLVFDTWYTKKQIGIPIIKQINSVFGILILSILMAIIIKIIIINIDNDYYKLIIGTASGLMFYITVAYAINLNGFMLIARGIIKNLKKKYNYIN